MDWLENIRIVLVGSQEPMNIGAAARAMQNFGIQDLWLVAPEPRVREDLARHPGGSMAYRLAVHAEDILGRMRVVAQSMARLMRRASAGGTPKTLRPASPRTCGSRPSG